METIRTNAVIFACAVAASKDWKGLFSSSDGNMIFTYNAQSSGGEAVQPQSGDAAFAGYVLH